MAVFIRVVCAVFVSSFLLVSAAVNAEEGLVVRYGSDMTLPWYAKKADQEYGIVPLFGKVIEQQTPLNFVITPVSKKRALDQLVKQHVDVISAIASPQLQEVAVPISKIATLDIKLYLHRRFKQIKKSQWPQLKIADNDGRVRVESALSQQYDIQWYPFYNLKDAVVALRNNVWTGY